MDVLPVSSDDDEMNTVASGRHQSLDHGRTSSSGKRGLPRLQRMLIHRVQASFPVIDWLHCVYTRPCETSPECSGVARHPNLTHTYVTHHD